MRDVLNIMLHENTIYSNSIEWLCVGGGIFNFTFFHTHTLVPQNARCIIFYLSHEISISCSHSSRLLTDWKGLLGWKLNKNCGHSGVLPWSNYSSSSCSLTSFSNYSIEFSHQHPRESEISFSPTTAYHFRCTENCLQTHKMWMAELMWHKPYRRSEKINSK
jgi:hypothetical protein